MEHIYTLTLLIVCGEGGSIFLMIDNEIVHMPNLSSCVGIITSFPSDPVGCVMVECQHYIVDLTRMILLYYPGQY